MFRFKAIFAFLCSVVFATISATGNETPWINAITSNLRSDGVLGVGAPMSLENRMAHYGVPGVAIAVIRDGKLVEATGFGVLQVGAAQQVNADTLFSMGSVSKVATAVLAHRMQADGVLSLDVDIRPYLKSWQLPDDAPDELISLRRIFSHTAGFNIHGFADFEPGATLPTVYDTLNGTSPARHGRLRFIAVPGQRYQYSGGGYTLAQLVLSDVSQMDFPELARTALFAPLDMQRSSFVNPLPEQTQNVAKAHNSRGRPVALPRGYEAMPEMAASGLWSSANDMGKLVAALIQSHRGEASFLPHELVRRMMQRVAPGEHGAGPRIEGEGDNMWFTHGGVNNSYRAWIEGQLSTGNGLVVLTNGTGGNGLGAEIRRGWRLIEATE
ncbi:serine hydrolase domain-containing protein [Kordiimonas aquimaris]|uniref:serine hydrolase domain-containing protein n=1 Tax=Kordiimonas aquimaris TaxID=707591 RepID=UPI0021CF5595|nr:serine hydrolase domain-containing protein [Kordiimonas aquimaris]